MRFHTVRTQLLGYQGAGLLASALAVVADFTDHTSANIYVNGVQWCFKDLDQFPHNLALFGLDSGLNVVWNVSKLGHTSPHASRKYAIDGHGGI